MITAKEAKVLYDESGAEVQIFLTNKVGPEIKKAAAAGTRSYVAHTGSEELWRNVGPTPMIRATLAELKRLGYAASFGKYGDEYVPRGLADDNGKGPAHQNYGITITW